ncbi:hypothetical protein [Streptomyces sp. NPDC002088]
MYRPGDGLYERIHPALRADPTMPARKINTPDETEHPATERS